jgi:predicted N-acetyltransferase YhbS
MPLTDHCLLLDEMTDSDRQAIAELIYRTWPKPDKDAAFRCRQMQQLAAGYTGPRQLAPRAYIVRDGQQVVANALIEPRTIGTSLGEMTILGLSKVCSDPALRGSGLGLRIVRAAFGPVDEGLFPFALFQTGHAIRPFYERIGACEITNRVIDSTSDNPEACPFADEVIARYPAGSGWPDGPIDLRGPGY